MPAPEENVTEVLEYLLVVTMPLRHGFSLGTEDAVYLVGRIPAAHVDDEELDRIAGSSLLYSTTTTRRP